MISRSISVVLAVRNGMPYLPEAVESALSELPEDGELVIRDNNSSDGTTEWLATLKDPRVRILRCNEDQPAWQNWSEAAAVVNGEWVRFLCADDYLLPNGLRSLMEVAAGTDAVMVASKRRIVDIEGKTIINSHGLNGIIGEFDGSEVIKRAVLSGSNIIGESNVMRRNLMLKALPFEENLNYVFDLDMYAKVLASGKFIGIDHTGSAFRLRSGSVSSQMGIVQPMQLSGWVRDSRSKGLVQLNGFQYLRSLVMVWAKYVARETVARIAYRKKR
jgi:glycosyltransferase involved in cell wall biosynthesis